MDNLSKPTKHDNCRRGSVSRHSMSHLASVTKLVLLLALSLLGSESAFAQARTYTLTSGSYAWNADWNLAAQGEFGAEALVVDWDDIVADFSGTEIDLANFLDQIGLINTGDNAWVTFEGQQFEGVDTSYFIERRDGIPDPFLPPLLASLHANTLDLYANNANRPILVSYPSPTGTILFSEDFESGLGSWTLSNGVWEVGAPASGPGAANSGSGVAATDLDADYPLDTDSRLESPAIDLPSLVGNERLELRFWHWFDYDGGDSFDKGSVEVSIWDGSVYGPWTPLETPVDAHEGRSSERIYDSDWSKCAIDLTDLSGERVRLGFSHTARFSSGSNGSRSGWFLDEVTVWQGVPQLPTTNFESGFGDWYADHGVWEIGAPSEGGTTSGTGVAATNLDGLHPTQTDSRLISPATILPAVAGDEHLELRFSHRFDYDGRNDEDQGEVQISVWDGSAWGAWTTLENPADSHQGNSANRTYDSDWTPAAVDLTAYATDTVRLAFLHSARHASGSPDTSSGWYLDDVSVWQGVPQFAAPEDFENGFGDWHADHGVWEVGIPSEGGSISGSGVAATNLDDIYPEQTDSRLISPATTLPIISGDERLELRFWHRFDYKAGNGSGANNYDSGQVQVSIWNGSAWGDWTTLATPIDPLEGAGTRSHDSDWTRSAVELTDLAGDRVRLGFYHIARNTGNDTGSLGGWALDDVSIWQGIPQFAAIEDFESGLDDWSAEQGVWEVGIPSEGGSISGTGVAATNLDGNYPEQTDSRLISPPVTLPAVSGNEQLAFRFWHRFGYDGGSNYDRGEVQSSVWDGSEWGPWTTLATPIDPATGTLTSAWTKEAVNVTSHASQTIRLAFSHTARQGGNNTGSLSGWYLDDIEMPGTPTAHTFADLDEGFEDPDSVVSWDTSGGTWEIGAPTNGPGATRDGSTSLLATVLDGHYGPNINSRAISPFITVPADQPRLGFWHWYQLDNNDDFGHVEVRRTGTGTWDTLATYTNTSSGVWGRASIDLSEYAGEQVEIAFRLQTDAAPEFDGWFIDEIVVTGAPRPDSFADLDEDFDDPNSVTTWGTGGGTWQIGAPTSGPGATRDGSTSLLATVLDGHYGPNINSRAISPFITVPADQPRLGFWHWYQLDNNDDFGHVEVRRTGTGTWDTLATYTNTSSGVWGRASIDLSEYAGEQVEIAFRLQTDAAPEFDGWFIDEIVVTGAPRPDSFADLDEDFDDPNSVTTWGTGGGTWQIGAPTSGPGATRDGSTSLLATVLDGHYGPNINSRAISPFITVPADQPRLGFWHWYQLDNNDDFGHVEVRRTGTGTWDTLATYTNTSSGVWGRASIDLSEYAGEQVEIAFRLQTDAAPEFDGWFIDEIVVTGAPRPDSFADLDEDFDDPNSVTTWGTGGGTWQIGAPTSGPGATRDGSTSLLATVLDGHYGPNINSRAISPFITVPADQPRLGFWHWYQLDNNDDFGHVEVRRTGTGTWDTLATYTNTSSGVWGRASIDLSEYAGEQVEIAFRLQTDAAPEFDGWFIDEIEITSGIGSGLLARYSFESAAADVSGNDNHSTPQNDFSYVQGINGQAIRVVGSGSSGDAGGHVLLPPLLTSGMPELTLSLWVKEEGFTDLDGEAYLMFGHNSSLGDGRVGIGNFLLNTHDPNQIEAWTSGAGTLMATTVDRFAWNHYALVYDQGIYELYINGILTETGPGDSSLSSDHAALGRHAFNDGVMTSTRFIGSFDEVRVYDRALGLTEVEELATPPLVFETQPVAETIIPTGSTATLVVTLAGSVSPSYQWYQGLSGDTSNPVPGATSSSFTTQALTATTSYWVRAEDGSAVGDSNTAVVRVLSSNAKLGNLVLSSGPLSPGFSPTATLYTATVPDSVNSVTLTPSAEDSGATILVNGSSVSSGSASTAIPLNPGSNFITLEVTSSDLSTSLTYTVIVHQIQPLSVTTGIASNVTPLSAGLNGTVVPNGEATVRFEYGTDTNYGSSTSLQEVSGDSTLDIHAPLSGLLPGSTYHFRLVAENALGMVAGANQSFTTAPADPIAVTGNPVAVTTAEATLVGAVDTRGLAGTVYFEYGLTILFGSRVNADPVSAGSGVVDRLAPITGLVPNATYHQRIVVETATGIAHGEDVTFVATTTGGSGTGTPTDLPIASTGDVVDITTGSAEMRGSVNPNGGTTLVHFEYGKTTSYGQNTTAFGVGNVSEINAVAIIARGLQAGTLYHYRLVATNSLGTSRGADQTFTTTFLPPSVTTGSATSLSTTSVRVTGTVRARNTATDVTFKFGTNPSFLNQSIQATPASVTGNNATSVQANLESLEQGTTYYYQASGSSSGGSKDGQVKSFHVGILSGLDRRFPDPLPANGKDGSLTLNFLPNPTGSGWRFAGELGWRASGDSATGLASGDRLVEFRSVAGQDRPPTETITIDSSAGPLMIERAYQPSGASGSGNLQVTLKPDSISTGTDRAQWRMVGETVWRDSGSDVTGLIPGNHFIEFKSVSGRDTPPPAAVTVNNGATSFRTITYYFAADPVGTAPLVLDFDTFAPAEDMPYAFVGQILSDAGAGSGFVVKPQVVATAGHVVFDDGTLAATTGVRWLFQRDVGEHEPVPFTPRGFYLMTGYAAQRIADDSPGISSPQSQNLDAAAMFFSTNISRSGFSGFVASDSTVNEFVVSSLDKTLIGYPVVGDFSAAMGKLHATPSAPVSFASAFGQTYTSSEIRGAGGMSGGPLCVRNSEGVWYPAAIFLGGTAQTVVRAIDSEVSDLIGFAESSAASGVGESGGSGVIATPEPNGTPSLGGIRVFIEPVAARNAGAGWRINAGDPYLVSGTEISDLDPNSYTVQFPTIPGFVPPAPQEVAVAAGAWTILTFTYEEIIPPPTISSPSSVTVSREQALNYQIVASPSPQAYNLLGSLPLGVSFDAAQGLISGTPQEAGEFIVTVSAENEGGATTKQVTVTSLPVIEDQSLTTAIGDSVNIQMVGSESGEGVLWTASGLPDGLSINPATGLITGSPNFAGIFPAAISVSTNGASSMAPLTLSVTGDAPVFTLDLPASQSIEFGTATSFTVEADGDPTLAFQWYPGTSGDTSAPIPGATSATYTTPPLTSPASYWVRATSISGSADSSTVTVNLTDSSNAKLSRLDLSSGQLSPRFNPAIASYQAVVSNGTTSISLTPFVQISQTAVTVDGQAVNPGTPSNPISLLVGSNSIAIHATAGNGISQSNYSVEVLRLPDPELSTGVATNITHATATLNGSTTPNGPGSVYFEYGPTASYGSETSRQGVAGPANLNIAHGISGLDGSSPYHFRIALVTETGTLFGSDQTFITAPKPPLVATGNALGVTTAEATLSGAINPNGLPVTYRFEYGLTNLLGNSSGEVTPPMNDGTKVIDVLFELSELVPNADYFFRLVATSSAGSTFGDIVPFVASTGTGTSDGIPDSPPSVTTGSATDQTTTSATLLGMVTPNDGSTLVWFEYGLSDSYGLMTPAILVGNGFEQREVAIGISGLTPATEYHFRMVAENSFGTNPGDGRSFGADKTFQSVFNASDATVTSVEALTPTSVRVGGVVDPKGTSTQVEFQISLDGITYDTGIAADESPVAGSVNLPVSTEIADLMPSEIYHLRIRVENVGGVAFSDPVPFQIGALLGLGQELPEPLAFEERSGQVIVTTLPQGIGGWRFAGDTSWRPAGFPATGFTTGDRIIEFQPVAGFIQPLPESISIVSGQAPTIVEAIYHTAGGPGDGSISVVLKPSAVSDPDVPTGSRAQWRLAGFSDDSWRDSGDSIPALLAGTYLIECRNIGGQQTPPPRAVVLESGETQTISMVYSPSGNLVQNPPSPLSYETATSDPLLPYSLVGQIRSDSGSHSGFVVKRRVVATAAQAVFDDATFTNSLSLQWMLQPDQGNHEPAPQLARGHYLMQGYAGQRESEDTPGERSIDSQNLNVAALYFLTDAGRGGFSGFVSNEAETNPHLDSSSLKTLSGFPVVDVAPSNIGRLHATRPSSAGISKVQDHVYGSESYRGFGGMIGGPLCVQIDNGSYYPAAIFVGGTASGLVREINSQVIDLFSRAEDSGNGGGNSTGGGVFFTSKFSADGTVNGIVHVTIDSPGAIATGAAWSIFGNPSGEGFIGSNQSRELPPGPYLIVFKEVEGFAAPAEIPVFLRMGEQTNVTFTYPAELSELEVWRQENLGTSENVDDAADDSDPDEDDQTNYDEFVAGTDPNNGADLFRILSSRRSGSTFTVTVAGKAGRAYELQRLSTVTGSEWSTVATSNLVMADALVEITDPEATAPSALYRVIVSMPSTPLTALQQWRFNHFETTANAGLAADDSDPDGDDDSNFDEYVAATDPRDGADAFRIQSLLHVGTTSIVSVAGKAGRHYELMRSTTLAGSSWTSLATSGPLTEDALVELTDLDAPADKAFYQVIVTMP